MTSLCCAFSYVKDSTTMITTRSALSIATTPSTPTPSVITAISTTPSTTTLSTTSTTSTNVVATTTLTPSILDNDESGLRVKTW
ncbi:unnamed protein product [Rotaria sordida]|uniref:Uncharacterized protein n=1 Tax=Rotaria sordida TaxID=392033 RepID=A0A815H783_9BILA|nr:unnamed protein product [Rotaria sordida]CAF4020288.1 unnamed protein product [Rotaria sordida]